MKKLLFILFISPALVFSQIKDANLWTGVGLDMDITKALSVSAETQVRFNQNMSSLNQAYLEISGEYELVDGLSAGITYRYARKNSGDYYFNQNRICLDVSYGYKLDMGLSFKTRARYQHVFDRISAVNGIYPDKGNIYRQSFKIGYKHKDFKLIQPYIGAEIFHSIQPTNSNAGFLDTYRFKCGLDFDLPKRQSIKLFYTFEHENRSEDNRSFIYGIQYNYEFKSLHKRKKKKKKAQSGEG
jgi:hypothetical protein